MQLHFIHLPCMHLAAVKHNPRHAFLPSSLIQCTYVRCVRVSFSYLFVFFFFQIKEERTE